MDLALCFSFSPHLSPRLCSCIVGVSAPGLSSVRPCILAVRSPHVFPGGFPCLAAIPLKEFFAKLLSAVASSVATTRQGIPVPKRPSRVVIGFN